MGVRAPVSGRIKAQLARSACLLCALVLAWATGVHVPRAQGQDIDTQRFKPRTTSGGFLQTEGSAVRHPVDPWTVGGWVSYGHRPLVVAEGDEVLEGVVDQQFGLDITGSYAFWAYFELGVHLPLAYLSGEQLAELALGDIRLLPKLRLLNDEVDGLGLAVLVEVGLPTHSSEFYGGAGSPAVAPRVLVDHRFGLSGLRLGAELGVVFRESTRFLNIQAGSELLMGAALGYRFDGGQSPVELLGDLRMAVGLTETDSEEVALEGLVAVGVDLGPEWTWQVGGGLGVLEGFGVPTARFFSGLRWEPSPNDPDRDGLRDPAEGPGQPAPLNRSEDDSDGFYEDEPASVDDVDDAARAEAIAGGYDACPDLPEDMDGVEDDDGCPEGDEDGDGVLDFQDRCEGEAETINGYEDDDGCPDEGPARIIVEGDRIRILETIRFEPNSARIDRSSYGIMAQIALTVRKHQEIARIEIGGHTDSTGPRGFNMRLSRERARAVRLYLLQRGIAPSRISARGYGPDHPVAENDTAEGRSANRRVEFQAY